MSSLAAIEGDYDHWIIASMTQPAQAFKVIAVDEGEPLPDPATVTAVLITGSGAMVTDGSEWIVRSAEWLRRIADKQLPVLGICFGHQLLAYALGGEVADNPNGVEVGTVDMHLTDMAETDPLFIGMSDMPVQASHRQAVMRLPPTATCLARTDMDSRHAFRYGDNLWGVQFHPEFNAAITKKYIEFYQDDLVQAGIDPLKKIEACVETVQAHTILQRFSALIGN